MIQTNCLSADVGWAVKPNKNAYFLLQGINGCLSLLGFAAQPTCIFKEIIKMIALYTSQIHPPP